MEQGPSSSAHGRAVRWCAVASCVLAGCYRPARLDCAVSCANGAPCPNGLTCGATDQLCHAGASECSASDLPPDDAAPGIDVAPGIDAPLAFCDMRQPGLIGCYEFENTANNAFPGLDIISSNVTFQSGKVGYAAAFNDTTTAVIAQDSRLDLTRFTIETWANPSNKITHNTTLVNHALQYGMTLDFTGAPACVYNTAISPTMLMTAQVATPLALDHWTHLACTYDGATLVAYVDGVAAAHTNSISPVATGAMSGIRIAGDPGNMNDVYTGRLDQLRIFNMAHTAPQICADAGVAPCP